MSLLASTGPLVQWSWVSSQRGLIAHLLVQHVELSVVAVAVGLAISFPLALVARSARPLRGLIIGFSGALYVVPAVALLGIMAPITGFFSPVTAEFALVSYTLLILVRNIVTGLEQVPEAAREAARGMGYTAARELWKVQLPLALPSMMGGLRVAIVTVVGLVNVTAFVNEGGLGQLVLQQGFQEDFTTPIVVGLVLSVALAALADAALVFVQYISLPWARSGRRAGRL